MYPNGRLRSFVKNTGADVEILLVIMFSYAVEHVLLEIRIVIKNVKQLINSYSCSYLFFTLSVVKAGLDRVGAKHMRVGED